MLTRTRVQLVGLLVFGLLLFPGAQAVGQHSTDSSGALTMGVIPLESPKVMFKQFQSLAKYLSAELGVPVKVVIGKDYQATMDAMGTKEMQFAFLTPTTYPKCAKQNPNAGVRPIVRFLKKGKGTYRSCIIVPADSAFTKIAELKGGTFAFGSKDSTSSHLMPRAMLLGEGIDIDKNLSKYEYLGSHTNVALAVKMNKHAAGAVKESVAEKFEKSGDVKILVRSKNIPEFPICVNKYMSSDMVDKITQALLKLKDSDPAAKKVLSAINKDYSGCESAKAEDYDPIREMVQNLYGDEFYKRAK